MKGSKASYSKEQIKKNLIKVDLDSGFIGMPCLLLGVG